MKSFAELSFEQLRNLVQDALTSRYGMTGEYGGARAWVCEMYDGYAIVDMDGKTYRCDYTVSGTDVTIGELTEVVPEYVPADSVAMALNGDWLEVFRAGDYGDKGKYTEADLDQIVAGYNPQQHEAPVVVGHPEKDAPAFGWVESLKREGGLLLAKLKQVPAEFEQLVKEGRYKKRSIALYTEPKLGLRHVGFLGAMPPEVKGLADPAFRDGNRKFEHYDFNEEEQVDKQEVKKTVVDSIREFFAELGGRRPAPAPQTQFSEEELNKKVDERTAELKKQLGELTTQFNEQKKVAIVGAHAAKAAELINALKGANKWVPAFDKMGAPQIFAELAKSEATIEFGEGDKKEAKPVAQVFADFLGGLGQIVPAGEIAKGAKSAAKVLKFNESRGIEMSEDSVQLNEMADKIAAEKNITFGEALKLARRQVGAKEGSASANAV